MRGILLAALMAPVFVVTAYTASCAGCSGIAANGRKPVLELSVACPPRFPLGTKLHIEGVGERICHDRGGAIRGQRLDLFLATRPEAIRWGRRVRRVRVMPEKAPKRPLSSTERADLGSGEEVDAERGSGVRGDFLRGAE